MNTLSQTLKIVLLSFAMLAGAFCTEVCAQIISGFSPQTISAGAGSQLTITGSGFGSGPAGSQKYVEFANADNGGVSYIRPALSEYVSWTDGEIVVKVPSGAATGFVRVVNTGTTGTSGTTLHVTFNMINAGIFPKRHVDRNGSGGYTFQLENGLSSLPEVKNAIRKSLKTWNCQAGINWAVGLPTAVNTTGSDGTNVIRFDLGSELPVGVLGVAYTYSRSCGGDNWEIVETDLVFDKETDWNFSDDQPGPTQIDFQSVALHELGHAHNLGHVNDDTDLMHYAISSGVARRSLSVSNQDGANYQMDLSKVSPGGACSSPMVPGLSASCAFPFPKITSVNPLQAQMGEKVTITGEGFTGATAVSFGGTAAGSFSVISDNTIEAYPGTGFTGEISVTAPGGIVAFGGFTFLEDPVIFSFSPAFGFTGDKITISGNHLQDIKSITFGGIPAATFTVINNQTIEAVLGSGASGDIRLVTGVGVASIPGFIFTKKPEILSVSPLTGVAGDVITITGTGFKQITALTFGNVSAASYQVVSENEIVAVLGNGGSGQVSLTSDFGIATFDGFVFIPAPLIGSFTPQSAAEGTSVSIKGENFTGATEVSFGGRPAASFTVNSPTLITAVPGEGESGAIKVKTLGGTATKLGFIFIETLKIKSYSPQIATTGNKVVIQGAKFRNVIDVTFGGAPARSFTVDSPAQITAVVGNGGSGDVTVRTSDGIISSPGFKFILPPAISYFTPASAGYGTKVLITGTNLEEATSVKFGDTPAASFKVLSSTNIEAVVSDGASGSITITTPVGSASIAGFTFIQVPVITQVDPVLGGAGTVINIYGEHLFSTKQVSIGATPAASFRVVSANHVIAIAANETKGGKLMVTTLGGSTVTDAFTFLLTPVVKSFSPQNAIAGVEVIITGSSFSDITSVKFGGREASSFKLLSATSISAVVAPGSSSGVVSVSNPGGTGTADGFSFNFTLPSDNFTVSSTDLTCRGAMNGIIKVSAQNSLNYVATLTGNGRKTAYAFNKEVEFRNYPAGSYTLCITIEGEGTFSKCFDVVINQPKDLTLFSAVNRDGNTLNLKMEGAKNYYIELNGEVIRTSQNEIDLKLSQGNNSLKVYTDQLCQGIIEKTFIVSPVEIYPNPFVSELNIALGKDEIIAIEIADMNGKIVFTGKKMAVNGALMLDLAELASGPYIIRLSGEDAYLSVNKIFKR